jgi:nicotinate-nucleotide adenylyltransferase
VVGRIGSLGGTFNPPHLGHLLLAQEAHSALGLDRVLLVAAGAPPHKEMPDDPGAERRLHMVRLAARGDDRLEVSDLEVAREGPSYTLATLRAIDAQAPKDELHLIVGGDTAEALPRWREPRKILELAQLAVAERSGSARRERIEAALAELGGARVTFLDMPRIDISSTEVRRRVAEGLPIQCLVPAAVADYIAAEGLYCVRERVAGEAGGV